MACSADASRCASTLPSGLKTRISKKILCAMLVYHLSNYLPICISTYLPICMHAVLTELQRKSTYALVVKSPTNLRSHLHARLKVQAIQVHAQCTRAGAGGGLSAEHLHGTWRRIRPLRCRPRKGSCSSA